MGHRAAAPQEWGWELGSLAGLATALELEEALGPEKTTLPSQGQGVAFPDSSSEFEGTVSWASGPALGP